MKKFLSLVLAMVMVTSLFAMTTTAGAADFTDGKDVTYQEAIDVISAIKVVDGYTDGSFRPATQLNRGQAAKIITNLILGPSVAAELNVSAAPFKDVPASHTFAAAISYCSQQKIINGYGDGTFKPDGTLTGYAFLKMLLGALGYDGEIEHFTGPNWTINVAKLADGIGLTADVADDFSGTATVNRETACLFAFNTLKADMVEYDNRITASVNGVDVTLGGDPTAKSVQWPSQSTATQGRNGNIVNDNIVQFAERYFSRLVRNGGTFDWEDSYRDSQKDDLGRPATTWTYRGNAIGTYAETPDQVYSGNKKVYEIYNDLGMTTATNGKDHGVGILYVNGVKYTTANPGGSSDAATAAAGTFTVSRSNTDSIGDMTKGYDGRKDDDATMVGNGTILEVYHNDKTNDVVVAVISVYGGKVSAVKGATGTTDDYVELEWGEETDDYHYPATIGDKNNNRFETTGFKEDDVVAYTYSDDADCIQSMTKIESVEGTLARKTWTKNLTLGETTYAYAKEYAFETGLKEADLSNNSAYVVYLDEKGNALWIEEDEFSVSAYALVQRISCDVDSPNVLSQGLLDNGTPDVVQYSGDKSTNLGSVWDGNRARLLFADGSVRTVYLDKSYTEKVTVGSADDETTTKGYKLTVNAGDVVRTRVNANGDYQLVILKEDTGTNYWTHVNDLKISSKALSATWGPEGSVSADSNTTFIVRIGSEWKVYTGIRNAPTVALDAGIAPASLYVKDGLAKIVFVTGGDVKNTSKDVTFLALQSVSKEVKEDDTQDYYVYNAVVRGEITTVQIKSGLGTKSLSGSDTFSVGASKFGGNKVWGAIYNSSESDADDIITDFTYDTSGTVSAYNRTGVKKVSASEIRLGGSILPVAAGVRVYLIDDGGDIESIKIEDVTTDQKAEVFYTMDDGEITNLFIVETTPRD